MAVDLSFGQNITDTADARTYRVFSHSDSRENKHNTIFIRW